MNLEKYWKISSVAKYLFGTAESELSEVEIMLIWRIDDDSSVENQVCDVDELVMNEVIASVGVGLMNIIVQGEANSLGDLFKYQA